MNPKTLFELSGATKPSISLEGSVLIIIDAQNEYSTGRLPLHGIDGATESIRKLLSRARKQGSPLIHILHEGAPGGLFDPRTDAFKSLPGLEPQKGEAVIIKNSPNSFAGTNLNEKLNEFGKDRTLVFVGFMTHMCVTATALAALDLGFQTAVVKDAVATRDLAGSNNEIVPARQVGQSSLAAIQDRIGWVIESREL